VKNFTRRGGQRRKYSCRHCRIITDKTAKEQRKKSLIYAVGSTIKTYFMEYKQIQELIKTINKSNISELSIEEGDFKITIKQEQTGQAHYAPLPQPSAQIQPQPAIQQTAPAHSAPPAADKPAAAPLASNLIVIKSPMIGTFYRSQSPDKPLFVNVGDEIKPGQVLCIIEAMKLFNEIESEISGRVVKIIADDSSPVEYDQPLFLVEPL
jgi:acetyl-CoA carboxylase biotin carboxyl carrier protein